MEGPGVTESSACSSSFFTLENFSRRLLRSSFSSLQGEVTEVSLFLMVASSVMCVAVTVSIVSGGVCDGGVSGVCEDGALCVGGMDVVAGEALVVEGPGSAGGDVAIALDIALKTKKCPRYFLFIQLEGPSN